MRDGDGRLYEIADPQGGGNLVRRGDAVRVRKPWPGESGFKARFMWAEPDGLHLTVYGGRGFDPAKSWDKQHGRAEYRTVPAASVHRMSQATVARRSKR